MHQHHTVFTFFKKYSFIGLTLLIFLAGCSSASIGSAGSDGWFDHFLVEPFSSLIKGIASIFGDNYGLSIILITLIIRLAIMPFMLKQMKSMSKMKEKMNVIKPEMDAIKDKYKGKTDQESKLNMQREMAALYQKHQLNPLSSMGCLPMLIQFPILIGFYYAIRSTPEIATHSFLWFNLGQTDIILPFIAAAIYFLQSKVSQIGLEPQQKKQMAIFGLISPVMIGFISFNAPAALPLYWTVGGLFLVFQSGLSKWLMAKDEKN